MNKYISFLLVPIMLLGVNSNSIFCAEYTNDESIKQINTTNQNFIKEIESRSTNTNNNESTTAEQTSEQNSDMKNEENSEKSYNDIIEKVKNVIRELKSDIKQKNSEELLDCYQKSKTIIIELLECVLKLAQLTPPKDVKNSIVENTIILLQDIDTPKKDIIPSLNYKSFVQNIKNILEKNLEINKNLYLDMSNKLEKITTLGKSLDMVGYRYWWEYERESEKTKLQEEVSPYDDYQYDS